MAVISWPLASYDQPWPLWAGLRPAMTNRPVLEPTHFWHPVLEPTVKKIHCQHGASCQKIWGFCKVFWRPVLEPTVKKRAKNLQNSDFFDGCQKIQSFAGFETIFWRPVLEPTVKKSGKLFAIKSPKPSFYCPYKSFNNPTIRPLFFAWPHHIIRSRRH